MSPLNNDQKKKYWRSREELNDTPEYREMASKEFMDFGDASPSRRRFMQLMGATLGVATASGCREPYSPLWPEEKILPYAIRPDGRVPGKFKEFATSMPLGGYANGVMVRSYDGRPTKVEGHSGHPAGSGTDSYGQGSIIDLYDPDRSKIPMKGGKQSSLKAFEAWAKSHFAALEGQAGKGLAVLAEFSASPSVAAMRAKLTARFPEVQWVEYDALSRDNEREGLKLAFGQELEPTYDMTKADVIVMLDSDLFTNHPARLRLAEQWGKGRNPESGVMNRTYAVESVYSPSGAGADHRMPLRSQQIKPFLMALEAQVAALGVTTGQASVAPKSAWLKEEKVAKWLKALAKDLVANQGQSVLFAGYGQPPEVHALTHRLNVALGNVGQTISYFAAANPGRPTHQAGLKALTKEMASGSIDTLVVLGANPVYTAPSDVDFAAALKKVKTSVHLAYYDDETSEFASWHVPESHYLEAWGTNRTADGTVCIAQPLINPLFESLSATELLSLMATGSRGDSKKLARTVMTNVLAAQAAPAKEDTAVAAATEPAEPEGEVDPELAAVTLLTSTDRAWRETLLRGWIENSAFPTVTANLQSFSAGAPSKDSALSGDAIESGSFEVVFYHDGKMYDGRFANNGQLQETPDFMTKLTWDNAALLAPATAKKLGVDDEDIIKLEVGNGTLEMPVWVAPGQALGSIGVALGYGRTRSGHLGTPTIPEVDLPGRDAKPLRTTTALWSRGGVAVSKVPGKTYKLASTQTHHNIDTSGKNEREKRSHILIRHGSLEDYKKNPKHPKFVEENEAWHGDLFSLFPDTEYPGPRWGMAVDMTSCIGCNACVVACNVENIVPIVGKDQVLKGREMHWMRLDRYFYGDENDPVALSQPMACVQCENAPCEQVCPVAATVHSEEGLNDMVYNRCVGTRYCANNCPYKVRRFNFHNYNDTYHNDLKDPANHVATLQFNPEVTVRFRGVMEKCTYCVQRIKEAKDKARNAGRELREDDVSCACSTACPTDSIAFGDLRDKNSKVAKKQALGRSYAVLAELNVRPRTQYLAKIENPNPELKG